MARWSGFAESSGIFLDFINLISILILSILVGFHVEWRTNFVMRELTAFGQARKKIKIGVMF